MCISYCVFIVSVESLVGQMHWISLTQNFHDFFYIQGPSGRRGDPGHLGVPGQQGDIGDQGHQGAVGANGAKGVSGVQGVFGTAGATGAKGIRGPVGQTGPRGPPGVAVSHYFNEKQYSRVVWKDRAIEFILAKFWYTQFTCLHLIQSHRKSLFQLYH